MCVMYIATYTPRLVLNKVLQRKLSVKHDMLTQAVSQGLRKALSKRDVKLMRKNIKINFYKVTQAEYDMLSCASTATFIALKYACTVHIVATLNAAQVKRVLQSCYVAKFITWPVYLIKHNITITKANNYMHYTEFAVQLHAEIAHSTRVYTQNLAHLLKIVQKCT